MRVNEKRNESEIAQRLRDHMAARGLSQVMAGKAMGLSGPTVSAYLAGTYNNGKPEGLDENVRQYLDLEAERAESMALPKVPVVHTTAFQEVTRTIKLAAQKKAIVSVTGNPGVGKTTAILEYVRTNSAAILVEVDDGFTSRDLFVEISEILGLPAKGSLHVLFKRIVEKIAGSGRIVIIDEAEYLPRRALDMLRRLRDFADVPVALVGLPRLNENIQGDQNNFAQLSSRMRLRRKITGLTGEDEEALIRAYLGQVPQEIVLLLRKYGQRNARILVDLMDWCLDLRRLNKAELSAELVTKAAELESVA